MKRRSRTQKRTIMPDTMIPPPPSSSKCYTSTDKEVVSRRAFRQHIIVPVFANAYEPIAKSMPYSKWETLVLTFACAFPISVVIALLIRIYIFQ